MVPLIIILLLGFSSCNSSQNKDVTTLIQELDHGKWRVRKAAAEALKKIGDKKAIPLLISLIPDWDARIQITGVLKTLGWTPQTDVNFLYFWIGQEDTRSLRQELGADKTNTF